MSAIDNYDKTEFMGRTINIRKAKQNIIIIRRYGVNNGFNKIIKNKYKLVKKSINNDYSVV